MNWPLTCAAVIPCRNEEASIATLVEEVRRHLPLVLVIDDCSDDETGARALQAGAHTLRRSASPGKGSAIKAGVAAALARHCTWAITLDGDGQHRPDDIPAFFRCAEQTNAALVVGNRMHRATEIPWLRRTVNRWMSRQISNLAGRDLPDSQCGFRLIDLKAWAAGRFQTDHFEIESEMLLSFLDAGYRVEFSPIQVVGRGRQSHIHPFKDTWRWLQWWTRVRHARPSPQRSEPRTNQYSPCPPAAPQNTL